MKPSIIVSSSDLERLEGLLTLPAFRSRSDLDGLRVELERADVREPEEMPADVITMNSRARFVEPAMPVRNVAFVADLPVKHRLDAPSEVTLSLHGSPSSPVLRELVAEGLLVVIL